MVVDWNESVHASNCDFRPRTTKAGNYFFDWEGEGSVWICVRWLFFNYIADLDTELYTSFLVQKFVSNVFVVRVVQLLVVDQLVDA